MKLSNLKYVLPELSALPGLAMTEPFDVLDDTVGDIVFPVECDCVPKLVGVEDWEVMDVELELAFVVVE